MSINWVMIHEREGFVRLPDEQILYTSPARTSLAITTPRTYPGNNPLAIRSDTGIVYLTNRRVVYLPTAPSKELQSFSAPLLNLHDTHVTVPWFGPNIWQATLQPVVGGNIPATHSKIEVKLVFQEGGALDYHSNFERIKERLHQAIEAARQSGVLPGVYGRDGVGHAAFSGVNMDSVHLDQLPSYEASGHDAIAPRETQIPQARVPPAPVSSRGNTTIGGLAEVQVNRGSADAAPPSGAPPGYEETQQQSVQQELERRLSQCS